MEDNMYRYRSLCLLIVFLVNATYLAQAQPNQPQKIPTRFLFEGQSIYWLSNYGELMRGDFVCACWNNGVAFNAILVYMKDESGGWKYWESIFLVAGETEEESFRAPRFVWFGHGVVTVDSPTKQEWYVLYIPVMN
jgi:hypothetical protein